MGFAAHQHRAHEFAALTLQIFTELAARIERDGVIAPGDADQDIEVAALAVVDREGRLDVEVRVQPVVLVVALGDRQARLVPHGGVADPVVAARAQLLEAELHPQTHRVIPQPRKVQQDGVVVERELHPAEGALLDRHEEEADEAPLVGFVSRREARDVGDDAEPQARVAVVTDRRDDADLHPRGLRRRRGLRGQGDRAREGHQRDEPRRHHGGKSGQGSSRPSERVRYGREGATPGPPRRQQQRPAPRIRAGSTAG